MRRVSLLIAALALIAPAAALAQTSKPATQCFSTRDWRGWKADGSKAMYIRVGLKQVYRVDFSSGCPMLSSPGSFLLTQSNTDRVCSAIDLNIQVAQQGGGGFSSPCIASALTPLSVAEIAALPKKVTP